MTPNPQLFQVLGFTPTLGQVRVATWGFGYMTLSHSFYLETWLMISILWYGHGSFLFVPCSPLFIGCFILIKFKKVSSF